MSAKIYVKKTKHQHLGDAASPLGFSFGMDSWCRFPPFSGSERRQGGDEEKKENESHFKIVVLNQKRKPASLSPKAGGDVRRAGELWEPGTESPLPDAAGRPCHPTRLARGCSPHSCGNRARAHALTPSALRSHPTRVEAQASDSVTASPGGQPHRRGAHP